MAHETRPSVPLTPTVTEIAALAILGLFSISVAMVVGGDVQDGHLRPIPLIVFVASGVSTVLVWRRAPLARWAAITGLSVCLVCLVLTSLIPIALLPALVIGLLLGNRHTLSQPRAAVDRHHAPSP